MNYKLFLDDERNPPDDGEVWVVCRSSNEAFEYIQKHGIPKFFSFDHDLGGEDTVMTFLKRWVIELWDGKTAPPDYKVHSQNPVGAQNIISYLETWKKICL